MTPSGVNLTWCSISNMADTSGLRGRHIQELEEDDPEDPDAIEMGAIARPTKIRRSEVAESYESDNEDSAHVPLLQYDEENLQDLKSVPLGLVEPVPSWKLWWTRKSEVDLDAIATQPSVYDKPDTAKLYYPRDDYEGIHRFDPGARWTWGEEKALVRKIDKKIMVFACIAFMALELDRANISQALTDNFLNDLKLDTNDYNLGNTIFKFAFLCAELPSQFIAKRLGPDRWIPLQMTLWSVVAASQYALSGRTSFLVCRGLLAVLQGGFIPTMILYLSYFYTSRELPIRLSFWWTAISCAEILSSILAYGLLHMRGVAGLSGWRWLFLVEGTISFIIGILAIVFMPPSPTQTSGSLRGKKGWFTKREETIIVTRALRDDPSKGTMHNRQPLTARNIFKSLGDYHLWPLYIAGLLFQLPMTPSSQYLTLNLRAFGYDTFQSNLLVIPSQIGHIIGMLFLTQLSELTGQLSLTAVVSQIWALPFLVAIYILDPTKTNKWVMWGLLTLLLSYPNPHAIQVGWNSRNSNTVRSRSVSAAVYNMAVQASAMIASNVYREDDRPRYRRGNKALIGVACGNIVLYILIKLYYNRVNKKRDALWRSMSSEEQLHYLENTKDEGNNRLDFRFSC